MKLFDVTFTSLFWRYNLMIALVAVGLTAEIYWVALLALPVFLSCLLGISFKALAPTNAANKSTNVEYMATSAIDYYTKAA